MIKGLKARKILVREAKSHGEATLIVGVSKPRLGIRPSASLAKYCASKLPKNFSIFAVNNGKVWFHRLAKNAGKSLSSWYTFLFSSYVLRLFGSLGGGIRYGKMSKLSIVLQIL